MNNLTLIVKHSPDAIFEVESFITGIETISVVNKNKLLIICSEVFENIIFHSTKPGAYVHIRIYRNREISVLFAFRSRNFNLLVSNERCREIYYDHNQKRYRGMGVRMCSNLSLSMQYRITKKYNAIVVRI